MRQARLVCVAVVVLGLVIAGCGQRALRGMQALPADRVSVKPAADQAAVVFLRSARTGTTTSLWELRTPQENKFIGLLVDDTRLIYLTAPGRTRFMVVGLSANFLDAELQAGKTYHVAVIFGDSAQEHFRLRPLRPAEEPPASIKACLESCKWVENGDRSQAWAREHANSVQRKKMQYLSMWESRPNRPVLLATDGR
jgi:hypothetical protein